MIFTFSPSEITTLKQWAKFVQLYAAGIAEFPAFAVSMAMSQAPKSAVCRDTASLPAPPSCEGYPLYWSNVPANEDAISVKVDSIIIQTKKGSLFDIMKTKQLCCSLIIWQIIKIPLVFVSSRCKVRLTYNLVNFR